MVKKQKQNLCRFNISVQQLNDRDRLSLFVQITFFPKNVFQLRLDVPKILWVNPGLYEIMDSMKAIRQIVGYIFGQFLYISYL